MIESLTPPEALSASRRIEFEDKLLSTNLGVLSDGLGNNPRAINNINAMVAKQKENAYDFQGNNLSLQTADFVSNLSFNERLIRQMQDIMLESNINTYDAKTREKIESYATVISDNYYRLGKTNLPVGELKSEVILERVAAQKAQIEQFAGKMTLMNPELAQSIKEKFDVKLFNAVVDASKNASISDEKYTPSFKLGM